MGEWIEWKGGLCPVPFTAAVQVQYRSGNLSVGSFIADEFKWSHVGCTADIIAYRVIEPEQPSEQAHIPIPGAFPLLQVVIDEFRKDPAFAAEMDKARIDLQAHMMSAPTRKHVSEQAMGRYVDTYYGEREQIESDFARIDLVVLTVAEHDELQQAVWRLDGDKLMLEAERDSLRAEVERLNAMVDAMCGLDYERFLELERLRKGRDDDSMARQVVSVDRGASVAARTDLRMAADTLDPRLGTPQPDGEPVAPMSGRMAYRWGMV